MKNKLKSTLQKILVISSVFVVLLTATILPVSASILPGDNVVYSNSAGYSAFKNITASMNGANGYADRYYTNANFTKDNVNLMGTNDVYDVAKPAIMLPMTTFSTDYINIYFDLPSDLFINEYNSYNATGYYRLRFGYYQRAYGNVTSAIKYTATAMYFQGEAVSNEVTSIGTYIGTGSSVPGVYNYFDMTVYFDENKSNSTSISITVTPQIQDSGDSDDWFRFSGTTPYYEKSFIAITPIYIERYNTGVSAPPYNQGNIIRYNSDTSILFDSYEVVGNTYINPFTQQIVSANISPVLYTNSAYPGIGYYFVPNSHSQPGGYLYKVYLLSNSTAENINGGTSDFGNYAQGFDEGYQSASDYYESIIQDKDIQYNNLLSSIGKKYEYYYDIGYREASMRYLTDEGTFLNVIDRAGNLVRNVITPFMDIGIFGFSISTIIGCGIVTLLVIVIIKKAR